MNLCTGGRTGYKLLCNGALYKCQCGNVGCVQAKHDTCTNQGFEAGKRCVKCGAVAKYELLSPETQSAAMSLMGNARASA